jgi:hypothetical protein
MGAAKTRFAVKRLRWEESPWDESRRRVPGEVTVAAFDSAEDAEAECRRREAAARAKVNPFTHGRSLFYWSHLDEPRFRDWLMDHGIDPPAAKKGGTNWEAWWKKAHKTLSAEQTAAVWDALDKVRFFAVVREPVRPVGYAVVMVNWQYNDENFTAAAEGGQLINVFRSRERAEAECESQNDVARDLWGDQLGDFGLGDKDEGDESRMPAFEMHERLAARNGGQPPRAKRGERPGEFMTADGVPFYEVVEVELEGLE